MVNVIWQPRFKSRALIRPGQIYNGRVIRVEPFGLFVEANGVPGLLRITELSWGPVRHPSEVADVGDDVTFLAYNGNRRADEQFNGSVKILDTRLRPSQDRSGLTPLPLIQLLQLLLGGSEYQGMVSPTVYVSRPLHGLEETPLLLRPANVAAKTNNAMKQKAAIDMDELLPVWLAEIFVADTRSDLARYTTEVEVAFCKFLGENT